MAKRRLSRDELVTQNMGFVYWMAKKYAQLAEYDELIGAGELGLVEAANRYNPRKGKFTTYAMWWVRKEMLTVVQQQNPVRVPSHRLKEIAPRQLLHNADSAWWQKLQDRQSLALEKVEEMDAWNHLRECLALLSEQHQEVLAWRFGLDGRETLTLEETGKRIGLCRERIRQLQNEALGRLRKVMHHGQKSCSTPA